MLSRRSLFLAAFALTFASAIFTQQIAGGAEPPASSLASASPAAPLVRKALAAEAAGHPQERADFVRRAIAADPAYAPAHWQNGEVRVKDRWLPVDEAAGEMARTHKIDEYRRLRLEPHRTPQSQRQLGDWCAAAGLDPQARTHWMMALALQPDSHALISKLGLARYGSELVPAEKLDQIRIQERELAATSKKWAQKIEKYRADFLSVNPKRLATAAEELSAIRDPAAIHAMESLSAKNGSKLAEAVVAALAGMSEQEATDALVRQAVCSQYDDVRQSASDALKPRSWFTYVPTLIGVLQAPIKVDYEEYYDDANSRHRLAMFQDGPLAAHALVSAGGFSQNITLHKHPKRGTEDVTAKIQPDVTREQDLAMAQQAEAFNAVAEAQNANAIAVLATATGKELGDKPGDWWDWWLGYNEIYQYPEKPVMVTARNFTPRSTSSYRVRYSSCFVAGTKVWTMDGPLPIEEVREGECVLAQSPATGELAYRPVVATTVRPTSPVRAIETVGGAILATRGHPFWVSGAGWRMTKELKPGDWLHTASGPVEIISVREADEAVCYNLVVADFGTYFVGEQKALVHDNTIRDVTPAVVPGLVEGKP